MKTLLFTVEDVTQIVQVVGLDRLMDETINGLTHACRNYNPAQYTTPVRGGFEYQSDALGLIEWMPALQAGSHATIKIVGYHPSNPESRKLPTILSVGLRFDTDSGHLSGLMDATFATALRTGAASAVASRILASPDPKTLGLIGCGAQAVTQLHALSRVFDFDQILVHDESVDAAHSFFDRVEILGIDARLKNAPLTNITSEADIICTATSVDIGQGPVFDDCDLQPAIHVNAVGSDFPGKLEIPLSLLRRAQVCPDFLAQATREGECQQLNETEIGPDLVELVQRSEHYAGFKNIPTVFDSTGWALEDHVVIDILTRFGRELGCGSEVQIESVSADPKNPYAFAEQTQSEIPTHKILLTVE